MRNAHKARPITTVDGRYAANCSCGWKGPGHRLETLGETLKTVNNDLAFHMHLVRPVPRG